MKRKSYSLFRFICLALLLGVAGFFIFPRYKKPTSSSSYPVIEEKPFVILIPSYNNSAYVDKNLRSVFSQRYSNYRVIYIDDFSKDQTLIKAQELLAELDKERRATLVHNLSNQGALSNIYNAVWQCADQEIIVLLDGDDFFAHEDVLATLNQAYADPQVWLTYGNYLDYPSYSQTPQICKPFPSKTLKKRKIRQAPWCASHLRTFYAFLCKQIALADFLYQGRFYPMGWDLALMIPMIEMAPSHVRFIDKCLYLYNRQNPISDHKINFSLQEECSHHIRQKMCYPLLSSIPPRQEERTKGADLLVFSQDNPLQLYTLLESIETQATGFEKKVVLYQSSTPDFIKAYEEVHLDFPEFRFIPLQGEKEIFKTNSLSYLSSPQIFTSPYLVVAKDTALLCSPCDIKKMTTLLEQTKGYAFYLTHHLNLNYSSDLKRYQIMPPCHPLTGLKEEESLAYAWQFLPGHDDWATAGNFSFTLYRREDFKKNLENLEYDSLSSLLQQRWTKEGEIGLFYPWVKAITYTLKQGQKPALSHELLSYFQRGLKVELSSLLALFGKSSEFHAMEIDITPPLSPR